MPHKGKLSAEEKIRIVEGYLNGKIGYTEAQEIAGINSTTLRGWISRYKTEGPEGFRPADRNRIYPAELKSQAVRDYLDRYGTLKEISEKHKMRSETRPEDCMRFFRYSHNERHLICPRISIFSVQNPWFSHFLTDLNFIYNSIMGQKNNMHGKP